MSVRIEKNESTHVTTIILDRPQHKNAINRPTADALTRAFRDFD
jgi:enoyl-CoA hydratase